MTKLNKLIEAYISKEKRKDATKAIAGGLVGGTGIGSSIAHARVAKKGQRISKEVLDNAKFYRRLPFDVNREMIKSGYTKSPIRKLLTNSSRLGAKEFVKAGKESRALTKTAIKRAGIAGIIGVGGISYAAKKLKDIHKKNQ